MRIRGTRFLRSEAKWVPRSSNRNNRWFGEVYEQGYNLTDDWALGSHAFDSKAFWATGMRRGAQIVGPR